MNGATTRGGVPVVAVVGRPNIGKSTLVNRILGRRAAIVQELPGVTRDRREFDAEWDGRSFILVDTGGWQLADDDHLVADIRDQAEAAMATADLVIFVVDGQSETSEDDDAVAKLLRGAVERVLLVANKIDNDAIGLDVGRFYRLGLGDPYQISAIHGFGVADLLDEVVARLPEDVAPRPDDGFRTLAIIGRPNTGKSTLLNKLVGETRVVVSPVPGTTRDPIDAIVDIDGEVYRVIDTAGIRRAPRVDEDTEFYSVVRAKEVLAESDVAVLMIDSVEGVTHQDQRIAEEAAASGSGIVVMLNKWDVADPEQRAWTTDGADDRLGFIDWAPVVRASAKTGARLKRLGPALDTAIRHRQTRIPTGQLNRLVRKWSQAHPPPVRKGRRPKIMYAVQAGSEPPTVILFTSGGELGPDYLRFIENRLRREFDFEGTPIRLVARRRQKKDGRR